MWGDGAEVEMWGDGAEAEMWGDDAPRRRALNRGARGGPLRAACTGRVPQHGVPGEGAGLHHVRSSLHALRVRNIQGGIREASESHPPNGVCGTPRCGRPRCKVQGAWCRVRHAKVWQLRQLQGMRMRGPSFAMHPVPWPSGQGTSTLYPGPQDMPRYQRACVDSSWQARVQGTWCTVRG